MVCIIGAIKLFTLAIKWPKIMKYWHKQEFPFLSAPYYVTGWSLAIKLRVTMICFTGMLLSKFACETHINN